MGEVEGEGEGEKTNEYDDDARRRDDDRLWLVFRKTGGLIIEIFSGFIRFYGPVSPAVCMLMG